MPSTARPNGSRDKVAVTLTKPIDKKFDLEAAIVFPTEHMRRIIAAAREDKSILELPVYDGSEKGEKVYNTLTVIGRVIAPNERVPDRCRRRQGGARRPQALAGHGELFRQGVQERRAGAGLCDQVRALRERHLARAGARLQRFRHQRRAHLARDPRHQALQVMGVRRRFVPAAAHMT